MNLASWIILAVVVLILGLAVRHTFFGGKAHGACCDSGDATAAKGASGCAGCAGCSGCSACHACAHAPQVRIVEDPSARS